MVNKEKEINSLKETLTFLQSELEEIYSAADKKFGGRNRTFFNLEFGMKNHIQKHLTQLANTNSETLLSYFETACLKGARI